MSSGIELQIVIDKKGVKCVRVVGPSEGHKLGHEMYFRLQDLIDNFDREIQKRLIEVLENKNGGVS